MTTRRDPPISAFCPPRRLCVSRLHLPAFLLHICHEREESAARRTCLDRGLPGAEPPRPAIQQLHLAGSCRALAPSTAPVAPKTTVGLRVSGCKVLLRACQAGRDIVCLDTGTAGVTRRNHHRGWQPGHDPSNEGCRVVPGRHEPPSSIGPVHEGCRARRRWPEYRWSRVRERGPSDGGTLEGLGRGEAAGRTGTAGAAGLEHGEVPSPADPAGGSARPGRLGEERRRRVGVGPRYSTTRGVGFRGRRVEPAGPIRSGGLFRVSRSGRHAILFHGWPGRPPVPGGIMETSAASRLGAIWKPWSSSFWPP